MALKSISSWCLWEDTFYLLRKSLYEGRLQKKWFLSLWGLTPTPLKSDKNIFYFSILDHFLSTFWRKWFFAPRKAENTLKNFQNELKALKVYWIGHTMQPVGHTMWHVGHPALHVGSTACRVSRGGCPHLLDHPKTLWYGRLKKVGLIQPHLP